MYVASGLDGAGGLVHLVCELKLFRFCEQCLQLSISLIAEYGKNHVHTACRAGPGIPSLEDSLVVALLLVVLLASWVGHVLRHVVGLLRVVALCCVLAVALLLAGGVRGVREPLAAHIKGSKKGRCGQSDALGCLSAYTDS